MPGLEDLYREIILDHYRNPRNRGELEAPPATRVEGFNPLCGDEIVVFLDVDGDTISDIRIGGQGCSISATSACGPGTTAPSRSCGCSASTPPPVPASICTTTSTTSTL